MGCEALRQANLGVHDQAVGAIVLVAVSVAAVVAFIVVSAKNSHRYEESLRPPVDLRRADQQSDPTGGTPNGGTIWPDNW